MSLSNTRPAQPEGGLIFWVRHGWAEQERTVATDAQAAGNTSPMLFGFLPRTAHEELRQNLAYSARGKRHHFRSRYSDYR